MVALSEHMNMKIDNLTLTLGLQNTERGAAV